MINHWTMKFKSLWPTFMRSIFVSYFTQYIGMFIRQIAFIIWIKTLNHKNELWTILVMRLKVASQWLIIPMYALQPSKSSRNEAKSLDCAIQVTIIYISNKVIIISLTLSIIFIQETLLKIWSKISWPWNNGHYDLHYYRVINCITLTHKSDITLFKIWSKITGMWNIGHCEL